MTLPMCYQNTVYCVPVSRSYHLSVTNSVAARLHVLAARWSIVAIPVEACRAMPRSVPWFALLLPGCIRENSWMVKPSSSRYDGMSIKMGTFVVRLVANESVLSV